MEKFKKGSKEERMRQMLEIFAPHEENETEEDEENESSEFQKKEEELGIEKHKPWVPGLMGNSYNAETEGDEGVRDMSNEDGPQRPRLFGKGGVSIHLNIGSKK